MNFPMPWHPILLNLANGPVSTAITLYSPAISASLKSSTLTTCFPFISTIFLSNKFSDNRYEYVLGRISLLPLVSIFTLLSEE